MTPTDTLHGTAVAVGGNAVLIRGPSGSGKSDLALRCLALPRGFPVDDEVKLVADDRVVVTSGGTGLVVSAPPTISGKLEVRGVGIIEVRPEPSARLVLVADLVPPGQVERLPEPATCRIAGVEVPLVTIVPFEPSAPVKLMLCLLRCIPAKR